MFQIPFLSPLKRNCLNRHHKLTGREGAANEEALLNDWLPAGKNLALKRMLMRKVTVRPAMRKTRYFPWMFMWYLSKPVRTCALTESTVVPALPEHWEENQTPGGCSSGLQELVSPVCGRCPRRELQFLFGPYVCLLETSTSLQDQNLA